MFQKLAGLLAGLHWLDIAAATRPLQAAWLQYKRMVKGLRQEPEQFGGERGAVRDLERVLLQLEERVLMGGMMERVLGAATDCVDRGTAEQFATAATRLAGEVEGAVHRFLPAACLAALAQRLAGPDRRLTARLAELARKLPGCAAVSGTGMLSLPEQFLARYLPQSPAGPTGPEKKAAAAMEAGRKSWLAGRLAGLSQEVRDLQASLAAWAVRMEESFRPCSGQAGLQLTEITERAELAVRGLALARNASTTLSSTLGLFLGLEQPLTKSAIVSLGDLVVEIKTVEETIRRLWSAVGPVCRRAAQHTQFLILNLIQQIKKQIVSDKKYSDERLDLLSCLLIAEQAMAGPASLQRHRVASLAISLAGGGRGLREEEWRALSHHLAALRVLVHLQSELRSVCSTRCLLPNSELTAVLLSDVWSGRAASKLPRLLAGLQDCAELLGTAQHTARPHQLRRQLRDSLEAALETELVQPLCQSVETELRLAVHQQAGLQVSLLHQKLSSIFKRLFLLWEPIPKNCTNSTFITKFDMLRYT